MARALGIAMVGMGGAVASTVAAGLELLRSGERDRAGLPLAGLDIPGLADYADIAVAGWDVSGDSVMQSAKRHGVVDPALLDRVADRLETRPWPAFHDEAWCPDLPVPNRLPTNSYRAAIDRLGDDLHRFRDERGLDEVVVVNLASTERDRSGQAAVPGSLEELDAALDRNDGATNPATIYAYAALAHGYPYANFTPSRALDGPALIELAERQGVPVAGKDGKTGQTLLKTVLAPAFRDRGLQVASWYSTNLLGNLDGQVLRDEAACAAKIGTKRAVLDTILGYQVEDHRVSINYARSKGDDKEAWDSIDLIGFLGRTMQLKLNFLCADSILAAPLAIEIARVLDLAKQRGESGVQDQLGVFFKAPYRRGNEPVQHEFALQQAQLLSWLQHGRAN